MARKSKQSSPKPLEEMAHEIDRRRRRRIGAACTVLKAGLKIEQMLQWLYTQERKSGRGELSARSWEEWAATLKCHPVTAKRNAQKAFELGLLQYSEGLTRFGGDSKNRFAIDWEGIDEALGSEAPPVDRGAKCVGEGSILRGGGEQNAHAFKEVTLLVSLDNSLSTTSTIESTTTTGEIDLEKAAKIDAATAAVAMAGVSLTNARSFATRAIERGDDVGAIVAAWRPLAATWEPKHASAILAIRLRDGLPGCGPADGWPAPTFPDKLPRPAKAPKTAPNEPEAESARESTARLEAKHGSKLDAMGLEERVALVGGENSFLAATVRRGGGRGFLLERLEARSNGGNEARQGGISPQNKVARHSPADLQKVGECSDCRGVGGGVA